MEGELARLPEIVAIKKKYKVGRRCGMGSTPTSWGRLRYGQYTYIEHSMWHTVHSMCSLRVRFASAVASTACAG